MQEVADVAKISSNLQGCSSGSAVWVVFETETADGLSFYVFRLVDVHWTTPDFFVNPTTRNHATGDQG